MLLKDIPYFVKFTFKISPGNEAITTTDSEALQYFVDPVTDEALDRFEIGQTIKIYENVETGQAKTCRIKNISIQQLFEDTEMHKYGIDSSDAIDYVGQYKEWLFKVFIEIELLK